ncbi:unnamed protein product [Cochlearia groenlandica]
MDAEVTADMLRLMMWIWWCGSDGMMETSQGSYGIFSLMVSRGTLKLSRLSCDYPSLFFGARCLGGRCRCPVVERLGAQYSVPVP